MSTPTHGPSDALEAGAAALAERLGLAPQELLCFPACELCGSDRYRPVISEDFGPCHLHAVRCERCGLCYSRPRPTLKFIQMVRQGSVRNDLVAAGLLEAERATDAETIFDYDKQLLFDANYHRGLKLLQSLQPQGRLLDIGCAGGRFVELAAAAGYEAIGCDVAPEALVPGLTRGLDLRPASPNGLPPNLPPLQIVTLWNVLEHAEHPRELLRAAAQALAPGGLVFIEVPNMALRLALATLQGPTHSPTHRYILYEHIYHYTPRTLKRLLVQSGLRPIRFVTTHDDGSRGWKAKMRAATTRLLHRLSLGMINWHYPLVCVARKDG